MAPALNIDGSLGAFGDAVEGTYRVTCQVVTDTQGRESMHVRGSLFRDGLVTPLEVLGHVDTTGSFAGREAAAAAACVARFTQAPRRPVGRQGVAPAPLSHREVMTSVPDGLRIAA